MDHFAGLDVSVKETSVCIVDDSGKIAREVKVASEPEALLAVLKKPAYRFKRIGLEAGPLSQWPYSALDAEDRVTGGLCRDAAASRAVLKAQINKTDRNDARGIARIDAGAGDRAGRCRVPTPNDDPPGSGPADGTDLSQAAGVDVPARFETPRHQCVVWTDALGINAARATDPAPYQADDEMMRVMLTKRPRSC